MSHRRRKTSHMRPRTWSSDVPAESINGSQEEDAQRAKTKGAVISSSLTKCQGHGEDRKGTFVINLSVHSKHWTAPKLRMDDLTDFAVTMQKGDRFLSFYIYKGYWLLFLHPLMREWFLFRYKSQYYRCIALPMGWSLSPWWFTQTTAPFVREMRAMGYRVLGCIHDFLLSPAPMGGQRWRTIA